MQYPTDQEFSELHEILHRGTTDSKARVATTWQRIRSWSSEHDHCKEWLADFNRRAAEALNGRDGLLNHVKSLVKGGRAPRPDIEALRDWSAYPVTRHGRTSSKGKHFDHQNRALFAAYARLLAVERSSTRSTNYPCPNFAHELALHSLSLNDLPADFSGGETTLAQLAISIQQSRKGKKSRKRDSLVPEIEKLLEEFPELSPAGMLQQLRTSGGKPPYERISHVDDAHETILWGDGGFKDTELKFDSFKSLVRAVKRRLRKKSRTK